MFDSHIHSSISSDSTLEATDALRELKEKNIGGTFTEHYDFGYPEADSFLFDPKGYFSKYDDLRSSQFFLGVELGLVPGFGKSAADLIRNYPFDYVIGSIHVVENIDIYYPEFYTDRSKTETYGAYLKAMEACILEFSDFDALGHIDYIARYAPYPDPEVWSDSNLHHLLDRVLKALIETGRVLELNTRRIETNADFESIRPIYIRYAELGGHAVTLGSDAHTSERIGWKIREAHTFIESLGLKAVVFQKRKMIYL
ncbi:histidinol phosphate phosphatase [Gottschalkiaceae bacterium SANA]|nr:histidinol phosphate phosphatase [Gottschalkiaceae bacterium SANA]